MKTENGVLTLSSQKAEGLLKELVSDGWTVFYLPNNILSKSDFFSGVIATLPLDPPLQSNRSWDALSDSLWEGLLGIDEKRIAIVWPNPSKMKAQEPSDCVIAESVLKELTSTLDDPCITSGPTKRLRILLVEG